MITARQLAEMIEDSTKRPTKLRPAGRDRWRGLCPFCSSRNPTSFSVGPLPVWHCFSCGATGNAVTWQREVEGSSVIVGRETREERRLRQQQERAAAIRERQIQAFLDRNPHFAEEWYFREFPVDAY